MLESSSQSKEQEGSSDHVESEMKIINRKVCDLVMNAK